jgi:membrane protein
MRKLLSNLPTILKLAYQGWKEDRASRLSAALAYYTIFSLAPLLVIVIAITGLIWEADVVRTQLLNQIQGLVGVEGANFVADLISSTGSPAEDIVATIIGIITLLFGALGVFNELHNSLNIIWEVEEEKPKGFVQTVKKVIIDRLLSFTMILGIGFLLLVSLVISAGLSATQETIGNAIPLSEFLLQIVNTVISIGVITVLFALMYKFLPDAEIAWQDVWVGAFFTSIFFSLGKTAIGLYLGNSAVASSFGAAGSLVLLLLWIYYSAQILFFGAEVTQVYANKYGSKIVPEGEEKTVQPQPQSKAGKELRGQPALIASPASNSSGRESRLERENQQTARVLLRLMVASFFTGIMTTILGLKRR